MAATPTEYFVAPVTSVQSAVMVVPSLEQVVTVGAGRLPGRFAAITGPGIPSARTVITSTAPSQKSRVIVPSCLRVALDRKARLSTLWCGPMAPPFLRRNAQHDEGHLEAVPSSASGRCKSD